MRVRNHGRATTPKTSPPIDTNAEVPVTHDQNTGSWAHSGKRESHSRAVLGAVLAVLAAMAPTPATASAASAFTKRLQPSTPPSAQLGKATYH